MHPLVVLLILVMTAVNCTSPKVCLTELQQRVMDIVHDKERYSTIGILCAPLDANSQILFEYNSKKLFSTASINKVLTTIPALLLLGPDYRFETKLYVRNHSLRVVTRGDPSLSSERLQQVLQDLHVPSMNITSIVLDVSAFGDTEPFPDTWEFGDLEYDYGAQPTCAVIDHNYVYLKISPGRSVNDNLQIEQVAENGSPSLLAKLPIVGIENTITKEASSRDASVSLDYSMGETIVLRLSGSMRIGDRPITVIRSVLSPNAFIAKSIQNMIPTATSTEVTTSSFNSSDWKLLSTIQSLPAKDLMNDTLQVSDNLYAELFSRQIGLVSYEKKQTTTKNVQSAGIEAARKVMLSMNVTPESFTQADGSGLSRRTVASPQTHVQLFHKFFQDYPDAYKLYYNLLPVGGRTGTLKNRFTQYPGIVHAKTGSMTGVVSLAGFVSNQHYSNPLAFSIMVNNSLQLTATEIRAMIDEIVLLFAFVDPSC